MFDQCTNENKCCEDCNEKECIYRCDAICFNDCKEKDCPKIEFSLEC